MLTVWPESEWARPADGGHGQMFVQVRKERPCAGGLPTKRQSLGTDRDDQQLAHSMKMAHRGVPHLRRRREVDEAVALIDG